MSHKRIAALVLVVVAVVFAAAGCGGSPTVATVGKQKITKTQLDAKMTEALGSYANSGKPAPKAGTSAYKSVEQQVVQYLVQTSQRDQAAAKMGIEPTPKQIDGRVAVIKSQSFHGSQTKFDAALKKAHVTVAQMRDDVRQQLIDEQLKTRITKGIRVSPAEVKEYYANNKTMFSQPETRDVRHILVKTKQQADQLYAKLQAGADFATLAKKYSTDPGSAQQGGKLTIGKGQTVPEFDKVAFSLPTGQMAPPVHTRYGWHIIQALGDVKPAGVVPFAKVAAQIQQQIIQSKQSSALSNWMQKVAKTYPITYAKGYAPPKPAKAPPTSSGK